MSIRHSFVVVVLLLTSGAAFAQTVYVTGRVADPQGAVVSGAVVTLNSSSAAARTTSTTADGTYSFAGVPAGLAVLQVESPGFERWSRSIAVSSATSSFDVALQVPRLSSTTSACRGRSTCRMDSRFDMT